MKKTIKGLVFLTAAICGLPAAVQAEELLDHVLEPEQVYELNLRGDETPETFSYKTYVTGEEDGESKAVLDLYLDQELVGSFTEETWSYCWRLSQCTLTDDRVYLLAASISDNDSSPQVLLLGAGEDGFETIADLAELTRQTDAEPGRLVSAWARTSAVSSANEDGFTVDWFETFRATGAVTVAVPYLLNEDGVTLADAPCLLDETQEWTAWQAFDVLSSTEENAAVAYQVAPGDVVHLTEYVHANGRAYLRCINQNGEEGWMPDAEEYDSQMAEDGQRFLCGYFEEAIYAG